MNTLDRRAWLLQALEQDLSAPSGMEAHAHQAWEPEFTAWLMAECVFRDRSFQSISSLHVAFSEWAVRTDSVPCRRDSFEALLANEEFTFADGLVYGLLLRSELAVTKRDR